MYKKAGFPQSSNILSSRLRLKPTYPALKDEACVGLLGNDFVAKVSKDPRIGHYFAKTNAEVLSFHLIQQICEAAGGPCKYAGKDMKTAHAGMGISKADFNALVEVLQGSMDRFKVPLPLQLELLSMLAPMHRDMIEK